MRPCATAASAGSASGCMRTNHCSLTSGSMISPLRCDRGALRPGGGGGQAEGARGVR